MARTERGFGMIEVTDTRGCICRVQRSSADPLDRIWIFCDDPDEVYKSDPAPYLNPEQAREVAKALLYFADGKDLAEGT